MHSGPRHNLNLIMKKHQTNLKRVTGLCILFKNVKVMRDKKTGKLLPGDCYKETKEKGKLNVIYDPRFSFVM